MSRLRSDIFVAAYVRRRNGENAFAVVRKRGAAEAGAIFVCIDRRDGTIDPLRSGAAKLPLTAPARAPVPAPDAGRRDQPPTSSRAS